MGGRSEKEVESNKKMKEKLKGLPKIFSEFYYHMYSTKSYTTIESYINYIKEFALYIGEGEVKKDFYKKVKPQDVNMYFAENRNVEKDGKVVRVSDSIRATKWSALNTFFNFLEKQNYIRNNPVAKTDRPKVQDSPDVAYLTEEEMQAILENVRKIASDKMRNRDLALISLGLTTGLRVSAITQIDVQDIDFDNNVIKVIEKRGKACNTIFGANVKEHLLNWLKDREKYFKGIDTDALFISNVNGRITKYGVRQVLNKYSSGITNKHITPHVMRHSCATNLYEKTGDIYLCATVLNHKNVATTQRYADISQKKKQSAIDILDEML